MKRVKDEPYFTYSAYSASTSSIYVKCENCKGLGFVSADGNVAHFKCTCCGASKMSDCTIYHYDVHNQCKACRRFYRVDINDKHKQHFTSLHVACPYCGYLMSGTVHKTAKAYHYTGEIKQGREPYFGLELWFLTHVDNKVVWAINPDHLTYLITYLGADIREKAREYTALKTQGDHLPTFMKTSKNRDKMVKVLKELQKK